MDSRGPDSLRASRPGPVGPDSSRPPELAPGGPDPLEPPVLSREDDYSAVGDPLPGYEHLSKYDVMPKLRHIDTGSRYANFVLNRVVLPWVNLGFGLTNAVTETVGGIDEALRSSRNPLNMEYQAAGDILPMAKAMGVAVELGGVAEYAAASLHKAKPTLLQMALVPVFGFTGVPSPGRSVAPIRSAGTPIRAVEKLGTTPLVERDAAWARYQVFGTRTRSETVFRITYADGNQRIVVADKFSQSKELITEAKYGDMGQMFRPEREAHILDQARTYLDIANELELKGGVRYVVSTKTGAERLRLVFQREFPEAIRSGQIWVDWLDWNP